MFNLADLFGRLLPTSAPESHDVAAAGQAAIAAATAFWQADIYDPARSDKSPKANDSRAQIDAMLRACGWTWEVPYLGDGQVEWCGIFAGACWVKAGLDPEVAKVYFPSTYRLNVWGHYRPYDVKHTNKKPAEGPYRLIVDLDQDSTPAALTFAPQAGDILVIGDKAEGQHITLVETWDPTAAAFHTLEGNGVGLGPDGKRRQGVVRGVRKRGGPGYCARRLIRPAPSDLV